MFLQNNTLENGDAYKMATSFLPAFKSQSQVEV